MSSKEMLDDCKDGERSDDPQGRLQALVMPLPRYGLQWNGPKDFIPTEMNDGYWTPWHLADEAIKALQQEVELLYARLKIKKLKNEFGKEHYLEVTEETPFSDLEFHEVPDQMETNKQWALHTNIGSLTVLDRLTGYEGGVRDIETGYRATDGKFWLASGGHDVRQSAAETMQDAIDWVKQNANTCAGV